MKKINCLFLPLLLTISCVQPDVSVTRLSNSDFRPKPANCEIIILTQMPTDKKYEEIAIITATTGDPSIYGTDLNSMLPNLKAKACSLGADAIVIRSIQPGDIFLKPHPGNSTVIAIKYIH